MASRRHLLIAADPCPGVEKCIYNNDGEYVGGCIAGGRRYLHINANGDVDPCVFIHYSNYNIREMPLLDCLRSPLFMAYHDGQPFNDNHCCNGLHL